MNKKSIIFFVLAVILAVVGFSAKNTSKQTDVISNAVYVSDGKVVAENEGKVVIVAGKPEAAEPLVDKLTGVALPGVRAKRNVERYEKVTETKEEKTYNILKWEASVLGNDNEFNQIVSSNLMADCKVGEFELDKDVVKAISCGNRYHSIDKNTAYQKGFYLTTYKDFTYLTQADFMPYGDEDYTSSFKRNGLTTVYYRDYENMPRISYSVQNEKDTEFTFIGTQKDGKLVYNKDLGMQAAFSGIQTPEQLAQRVEKGGMIGAIVAWALAAFLIFLGVFTAKKKYVPTDEELKEIEEEIK